MPKVSTVKDVEKRIDVLERLMKLKDNEIIDLKSSVRAVEKLFTDELHKRDVVITDLYSLIDDLKTKIPSEAAVAVVSTEITESAEIIKNEHDLLIIGDSLVRELDAQSINPGGDTIIECLPGARPDELTERFREMSKTDSFRRVIVHGGTNLVPKFSPTLVADKITRCLEMIRELSPNSQIAFSSLLPKEGVHLLNGINEVNYNVFRSGLCGHFKTRYGFVNHRDFFLNNMGHVNGALFKNDSLHLSDHGVKAFEKSLKRLAAHPKSI